MGSFDAVVEPLLRPMISFRRKSPDRFDVTAQLVRHDDTRLAEPGYQSRKEALGSFGISRGGIAKLLAASDLGMGI